VVVVVMAQERGGVSYSRRRHFALENLVSSKKEEKFVIELADKRE